MVVLEWPLADFFDFLPDLQGQHLTLYDSAPSAQRIKQNEMPLKILLGMTAKHHPKYYWMLCPNYLNGTRNELMIRRFLTVRRRMA